MAEVTDGTVVDSRYNVRSRIGSGGMADVYLADDAHLGRQVALKVLHRRFARDHQFVERFRREASAAAGLQHPNVVSVYDRGEHDGTYYIAMENLPGRTLRELLRQEAPLSQERAINFGIQILNAAGFAHKRGVVHRDFKPHNVIVAPDDSLKVTDFGIARAGASEMTETGSIMGTAQYLSPEQAQGHPVDHRSDLYSIGIMLYEMLGGRTPFTGDSAVSIALKHVNQVPQPLSQLRPDIHPLLEAAVMRAIAKDPAHRYQSADEFIAALAQARTAIRGGAGHTEGWAAGEVPPEEEKRRRWPWLVLALFLLLGGAALAFLLTRPDQVKVPNEVGRQAPQAAADLVNKSLKPQIIRVKSQSPVGLVVSQDPRPGGKVEKASTVKLRVSSGPGLTTVPDVTGKPVDQAITDLRNHGLFANTSYQHSSSVSQGLVISTTPVALSQVPVGSRVQVLVSSGPKLIDVPDVVGKQESVATATLQDAGFKVTSVKQDSNQPKGQVLSESPAAGSSVPKDSRVTITVSRGPAKVAVPDVTGKSVSDAQSALQGAGFSVTVTGPSDGTVVSQSPAGGTKADKGSNVTIVAQKKQQQPPSNNGNNSSGGQQPK
ncbi:MAG: serine/threonine protein kinase [Actinobacteria bacterium]|nr:serine/threonine protein kinase [Actinomycetota bacterium]